MNKALVTLMQDASLRKALGQRIKQLRKEKGLIQKELPKEIGSSHAQINKYESGLNTPPLDRLLLLAEVLDTSIDYLIAGQGNGMVVREVLDSLIIKYQSRRWGSGRVVAKG